MSYNTASSNGATRLTRIKSNGYAHVLEHVGERWIEWSRVESSLKNKNMTADGVGYRACGCHESLVGLFWIWWLCVYSHRLVVCGMVDSWVGMCELWGLGTHLVFEGWPMVSVWPFVFGGWGPIDSVGNSKVYKHTIFRTSSPGLQVQRSIPRWMVFLGTFFNIIKNLLAPCAHIYCSYCFT